MTILNVNLSAREMAHLIDGEVVEIEVGGRPVHLTAPPPDWTPIEETVTRYQHEAISAERAMSDIAATIADEESGEDV